jgi:hypothetical protein
MTHPTGTRVFARITPAALVAALFAGVLALTPLFGQSLADLARQERARKAQGKQSGKVFTNEDIQSTPTLAAAAPAKEGDAKKTEGEGKASAEGKEGSAPAEGKAAEGKGEAKGTAEAKPKEEEKPKEAAGPDLAKLEKEYRAKFAALRDALAYEQKKLDVMQRELNLMQTQYYSDPNVAMREQTFRGQINQRTQEIEQQKGSIEKAQKAVADLEEELRKKGLPAGWAR